MDKIQISRTITNRNLYNNIPEKVKMLFDPSRTEPNYGGIKYIISFKFLFKVKLHQF